MLIKKILFSVFAVYSVLFVLGFNVSAFEIPATISAESAVVLNADTKEIIYQKNAFQKMSMASTTKIMTSILAIESGRMNEVVTVSNLNTEGSSIGLKNGNKVTLKNLVYGMLLESGNDAAQAAANFLAGSEQNFSVLMNSKAKAVGMKNTNFVTSSGLDADDHYSTAYDMAILGAYAIENPVLRKICSDSDEAVAFIEPETTVYMSNHNKLLNYCEGVFGIKTGFTRKSGRCLVTACERDGVTLVAVTLNAPNDWDDHEKIYDVCFFELKSETLTFEIPETVKVYGSLYNEIKTDVKSCNYKYSYLNKKDCSIRIILPKMVYAPVEEGDVIGKVEIRFDGEVVYCEDIVAAETVERVQGKLKKESNFLRKISKRFFNIF